jgi:hypothetical protein
MTHPRVIGGLNEIGNPQKKDQFNRNLGTDAMGTARGASRRGSLTSNAEIGNVPKPRDFSTPRESK